ncbi:MAG TPA: zinc chelation protein SecC [Desulfurivibrio alkaliphilus]|uniref:Zinc chelation protein SecC n=1 Tax=Desulfurivibrio alkaliphilus TaxID=427923 RepID=A0A7C2XNX3_9BACT|nr:zinc chelation protein SecC [Desulfurivibrio alkaliphilus]
MSKIGRNTLCPCGSGRKFKKCCLNLQRETGREVPRPSAPLSLTREIQVLQEMAAQGQPLFKAMGVFILFATEEGDAWVLEVSEMDALQVAAAGQALEVEIVEDSQTLEIGWSHRFQVKNKKLLMTSYAEQAESYPSACPVRKIEAAISEIRQKISPELLKSIHLRE